MPKYELRRIYRYPQTLEHHPHEGHFRYRIIFEVDQLKAKRRIPPSFIILYQTETEYIPELLLDVTEETREWTSPKFFPDKNYECCPRPQTSLCRFLAPYIKAMNVLYDYGHTTPDVPQIIEIKSLEDVKSVNISI